VPKRANDCHADRPAVDQNILGSDKSINLSDSMEALMTKTITVFWLLLLSTLAHADSVSSVRYFESNGEVNVLTSGDVTASTPFTLASIGKTMTSVAILDLVASDVLSLDGEASRWVNEGIVKGLGGLEGVTLKHLLSMTSGLPDYLTDDYIDDALADPDRVQNQRTALSYAFSEGPMFSPGDGFEYSNTNYVFLGLILENATGLSYAEAMKHHIFDPAGMNNSFVFGSAPLPAGFPKGHEDRRHIRSYYEAEGFGDGGVISTASDVAKFYKALFVDRSLLTYEMMQEFKRDLKRENYGRLIEIEGNIYGHSGGDLGFSTNVRIDIKSGNIAIILIAKADSDTEWVYDALQN
jgi:D-alanyl-D-alanine carboxypeptidase